MARFGALLLRGLPAALGRFAPSGGSLRSRLAMMLNKRGSLRSLKDLNKNAIMDLDFDKRGSLRSRKNLI